jgi:YebC/PmpR family DNA-binding regulatory protein
MAGHSKWANIKHRKASQDKKRGKLFSRLIRAITVAAKQGGDVEANPGLRLAVDKALAANMTRDTIDRAIKRGAGGEDGVSLEEIRYEGYGPGGVAVMVDCLTDNRKRTVAEVRHAFSKAGGNLGTDGSVAYMFTKQGIISYEPGKAEDDVMEAAMEAGADDIVVNSDGSIDIITPPDVITSVKDQLIAAGLTPDQFEVSMEASLKVALDQDGAEKMLRLLDVLEDLDDVQEVYSNADISDEVLQAL